MKSLFWCLAAVCLCVPVSAVNADEGDGQMFISCVLRNGKKLDVRILEDRFTYRVQSAAGEVEMALESMKSDHTVSLWSGVGRAIYSSVSFHNQDTEYSVWQRFDRHDRAEGITGGVAVTIDGQRAGDIPCRSGQVAQDLDILEMSMTEAGHRWNRSEFRWESD